MALNANAKININYSYQIAGRGKVAEYSCSLINLSNEKGMANLFRQMLQKQKRY